MSTHVLVKPWRFQSQTTRLLAQQFIQVDKKYTSKLRIIGPFWADSTGGQWISLTKWQQYRKRFHAVTSSCEFLFMINDSTRLVTSFQSLTDLLTPNDSQKIAYSDPSPLLAHSSSDCFPWAPLWFSIVICIRNRCRPFVPTWFLDKIWRNLKVENYDRSTTISSCHQRKHQSSTLLSSDGLLSQKADETVGQQYQ